MPKIRAAPMQGLHPTQLTVGILVVQDKKKQLASMKPPEQQAFLEAHPMPAVTGPKGRLYITDHHHLGRAATEAGVSSGFFCLEEDFSSLDVDAFWKEMNKNLWVHPLDASGTRHYYSAIPEQLGKLVDDPYRSLAGYVRDSGGYDKTPTAFAEFVWADFFRRTVPVEDLHADFKSAVQAAVSLAHTHLAKGIPGFNGK